MQNIRIFEIQNPWRQAKPFFSESRFIYRDVFDQIKKWLDTKDILVLLGARQTGKSTLIFRTISELLEHGTNPQNIFYFNLDNILLQTFLKDIPELLDFIDELGVDGQKYLFIDEVQRLENAGLFLKQLYDLNLPLKIIVSGSSTLEIRAKIKESLTGRKKVFEIFPLSLSELNQFDPQIDTQWDLFDLKTLGTKQKYHSNTLNTIIRHLLLYGGYPKVYLQEDDETKIIELQEIYSSYLEKDVINFLNITHPEIFNRLLLLLAHQIGNIVNIQELASALQIGRNLIQKYLFSIEATYVAKLISPFYINKRQEVIKAKKVYFVDCGLRNFIADNFAELALRADKGALVENFVFQEMQKRIGLIAIKFWRTQNKAEVDFILSKANKVIPIEVKSGQTNQAQVGKSFINFILKYQPKTGFILTENYVDTRTIHNCHVYHIPYSWFLLLFNQIVELLNG